MDIIYVDDELCALDKFREVCEGMKGVKSLHCFSSSQQVLLYAAQAQIDIAFCEVQLPDMSGIELCRHLKQIDDTIEVVFITQEKIYAFKAYEVEAIGYLLKPYTQQDLNRQICRVSNQRKCKERLQIFIRTFGRFDVFVDGVAVRFSNAKSKEFLALLVDRRGGTVTMDQAITFLWADRQYDENVKCRYRAMLKSLRDTLKNAGISQILIDNRNSRCIDQTKFICDYYRLLESNKDVKMQFNDEYMFEYSWAEATAIQIEKIVREEE